MDKTLKTLRSQSKGLNPILNLGKNGLTDSAVAEVKRMLKQKRLIKIRLNAGIFEPKEGEGKVRAKDVAKDLAAKADALLVDSVGHVVVLGQKKRA